MTVMTQRRLEQLRRAAWEETRGFATLPHTQEYVIGLKLQVMELEERLETAVKLQYP